MFNKLCRMFSSTRKFPEWSFEQVKAFSLNPSPNTALIDVREPSELQSSGSIPNALNVPLNTVPRFLSEHPELKDNLLVFSCARGMRAEGAAQQAQAAGFSQIAVYYGSFNDWVSKI